LIEDQRDQLDLQKQYSIFEHYYKIIGLSQKMQNLTSAISFSVDPVIPPFLRDYAPMLTVPPTPTIPAMAPQRETVSDVIGFVAYVCEKCGVRDVLECTLSDVRAHVCNSKFLNKHAERLPAGCDIQKIRSESPEFLKNVIMNEWPQKYRYLMSISSWIDRYDDDFVTITPDAMSKMGWLARVLKNRQRLLSSSEYLKFKESSPTYSIDDNVMQESELLEFLTLAHDRTSKQFHILKKNGKVWRYLISTTWLASKRAN